MNNEKKDKWKKMQWKNFFVYVKIHGTDWRKISAKNLFRKKQTNEK